jgi:hypothetical protein
MGIFSKLFRKRKERVKRDSAIAYEMKHDYATAAKEYASRASLELDDNELIFADDCLDSAKDWIKAGNREEALNEARRALQGFMLDDWLKDDDDGEYLKELTDMVGDLRRAGFNHEADAFLTDINNALIKLGQKPVSLLVMSDENPFPADCPYCGAAITYRGNLDSVNCPFCGGVVHAVTGSVDSEQA